MGKKEPQYTSVSVVRVSTDEGRTRLNDAVAIEEPLEIRIAGESIAVTMRTPGHDRELALGFLFGEGIIGDINDIGRAGHCGRPGSPEYGNAVDVLPAPGTMLDLERIRAGRRGTLTSSACGVCGRERIDDLVDRCAKMTDDTKIAPEVVFAVQTALRKSQLTFHKTGGVHAAGAFWASGSLCASYEDIGRHNAVDKVVGYLLEQRFIARPDCPKILAVSSRASFEIVQKAAVAHLPFVIAVSAASSLAIDLAKAIGITLIGFVRDGRMVIYSGDERIQ